MNFNLHISFFLFDMQNFKTKLQPRKVFITKLVNDIASYSKASQTQKATVPLIINNYKPLVSMILNRGLLLIIFFLKTIKKWNLSIFAHLNHLNLQLQIQMKNLGPMNEKLKDVANSFVCIFVKQLYGLTELVQNNII